MSTQTPTSTPNRSLTAALLALLCAACGFLGYQQWKTSQSLTAAQAQIAELQDAHRNLVAGGQTKAESQRSAAAALRLPPDITFGNFSTQELAKLASDARSKGLTEIANQMEAVVKQRIKKLSETSRSQHSGATHTKSSTIANGSIAETNHQLAPNERQLSDEEHARKIFETAMWAAFPFLADGSTPTMEQIATFPTDIQEFRFPASTQLEEVPTQVLQCLRTETSNLQMQEALKQIDGILRDRAAKAK
jgi:hypothetical protein